MKPKTPKILSYSVFYEQAVDGGYVAFVPALPGCHTQGETLEETERNVKEAVVLYVESLAAHGEANSRGRTIVSGESHRAGLRFRVRDGTITLFDRA